MILLINTIRDHSKSTFVEERRGRWVIEKRRKTNRERRGGGGEGVLAFVYVRFF